MRAEAGGEALHKRSHVDEEVAATDGAALMIGACLCGSVGIALAVRAHDVLLHLRLGVSLGGSEQCLVEQELEAVVPPEGGSASESEGRAGAPL